MSAKALLVSMPYVHPSSASLALALLSQLLERDGIATSCLHGILKYPRTPLLDHEKGSRFLLNCGGLLFGAYLADDPASFRDEFVTQIRDHYLADCALQGLDPPELTTSTYALDQQIADEIDRAGVCLDRCEAFFTAGEHDVVGFSITFFTQLPASVALAERLRRRDPAVKIVFGGSGCVAEQAEAMMTAFPVIDAICYTEADDLIASLFRGLRGEIDLATVPGIIYRVDGELRRTPPPPLRHDLDDLPVPCHDAYFEQHAASEWRDLAPTLYFETARGCWWGQKHLCTFCGLSARELAFRSKSPDRLYDEIVALRERYPSAYYFHVTDDILDTRYFKTLLPRLARRRLTSDPEMRFFFEVKSNMRPEHLHMLAAAGAIAIQPGIESFSDDVLALMSKGATALQQIQFVKWAMEAGVPPIYNILLRNPGESASANRQMCELLPYLQHLAPPTSVVVTELERFSPYYTRADKYGIVNIRPKPYLRWVFPRDIDHSTIAYRFDYDHPDHADPTLISSQRAVVAQLRHWRRQHRPNRLYYVDRDDYLVIHDARDQHSKQDLLAGVLADLFRFLDRHRTLGAIRQRFPEIDPMILDVRLALWVERRLVCRIGDRYLALVPRAYERVLTLDELLAKVGASASDHPSDHATPAAPIPLRIRPRRQLEEAG